MFHIYIIIWLTSAIIITGLVFYDFQQDKTEPFEFRNDFLCACAVGSILGLLGPLGIFIVCFLIKDPDKA